MRTALSLAVVEAGGRRDCAGALQHLGDFVRARWLHQQDERRSGVLGAFGQGAELLVVDAGVMDLGDDAAAERAGRQCAPADRAGQDANHRRRHASGNRALHKAPFAGVLNLDLAGRIALDEAGVVDFDAH